MLTSCDKAVLNNVKVSTQGGYALRVQDTICEVNGGEFETNGQSIDGTSARTYSSTIYVAYGSLDIHDARIKYVKYGIEKHDLVENLSSNNNTFIQLENHDSDSADISPD